MSLPGFTHANQNTTYYALKSESATLWSTFPATSTINASGYGIINISSLQLDAQILTADASDLLLNGVPIATVPDISNVEDWALYPAVGSVDMDGYSITGFALADGTTGTFNNYLSTPLLHLDVSGGTYLEVFSDPSLSTLLLGSTGIPVNTPWANYPAVTDINASGNAITNATSVQIGGRTLTTTAGTANAPYLLLNGSNILSNWSSFNATQTINAALQDINNAKDIYASGTIYGAAANITSNILSSSVRTTSLSATTIEISGGATLTAASSNLLVNGAIVYTGALPADNTPNWANYPAVNTINANGRSVYSGFSNDISLIGHFEVYVNAGCNINLLKSAKTKSIDITQGHINQCNVVGDGTTNKLVAATTFGDVANLGYVEVLGGSRPAGFSSFYVEGGVTFDGGTVHGFKCTTAGAGIFGLARFEITPLLIYIASAGPITIASVTYTIITALLNVRVAAGTYVTVEHGNLGGFDGIYLQNTLNNASNTRVIMTAGGTLYNAGVIQANSFQTSSAVQYWGGVWNPSGGATPAPPLFPGPFADLYISPITYVDPLRANNLVGQFVRWFPPYGPYQSNANAYTWYTDPSYSVFSNTTLIGKFLPPDGGIASPNWFGNNSVHIGNHSLSGASDILNPFNNTPMGDNLVAIGNINGWKGNNTANNIIIGTHNLGLSGQGSNCVAIGLESAGLNQGANSIAIGSYASTNGGSFSNTIVLNATGTALNPSQANSTYISPIRNISDAGFQFLARNASTGEVIQTLIDALSSDVVSNWANYPAVAPITSGAGNSIAINASASVVLQHGTGAFNNGIYLQNTVGVGGVKLVFTGAGTLYNADEVQTIDVITPNGCRFYNGVYNPSGGSPPIIPVEYGRVVVDFVTRSSYLAYLTSGSIPAANRNTDSVFIGNLPQLTTTAAASTIAIGDISGMSGQQTGAVAIGENCGLSTQGSYSVAIGGYAGRISQGSNAVAIGNGTAGVSQGVNAVAIGYLAGNDTQGTNAVAIGHFAGEFTQGVRSVAIGNLAGENEQGEDSIAVGTTAGTLSQGIYAVAIGNSAGSSNQGGLSVAIGNNAGSNSQGVNCIAFGNGAGQLSQSQNGIAIGNFAGNSGQGSNAVGIGYEAGSSNQGFGSVAMGNGAGRTGQQNFAVAIGNLAGNSNQGSNAVAIGYAAGAAGLGQNAIVIGNNGGGGGAGQGSNSILLNATGAASPAVPSGACYILPVRSVQNSNAYQSHSTFYNDTTGEVAYSSTAFTLQVVATSATAIVLTPLDRGKTYILTGTTTQSFNSTALGLNDLNFYVIAKNGNALNGGDITISGATGNLTIHETKNNQNGGQVYLVWNGTGLASY